MDRHDVPPGTTREETAHNHVADLEIAPRFGVEFLSYWHDSVRDVVICFARAPDAEAMTQAHRTSHGDLPGEIIEVSEPDVVRFLGTIHDPADASEVTSAFRTVCFTDIVGSTELLDQLGQAEYMVLLTEHDLVVRQALVKWKGREVKHTGDGFMVAFEKPGHALAWSLDIRERFFEMPSVDVRIGLAAGEPVERADDIFGAAVTLASRICASAGPQQVYVSELVRDLGVDLDFEFSERTLRPLKGFAEPVPTYELLGPAIRHI